jgi:hypothetical protein
MPLSALAPIVASYTWSRCIDYGSSTYPLDNSFGTVEPYNRPPYTFNRTQNLMVNAFVLVAVSSEQTGVAMAVGQRHPRFHRASVQRRARTER